MDSKLKENSLFRTKINEFESESKTFGQIFPSNFIHKNFVKKEKVSKESLKRIKKQLNIREHKCIENGCNKVYRNKENLKLHFLNIHIGLKPYECNYCTRRFSHRNGNSSLI